MPFVTTEGLVFNLARKKKPLGIGLSKNKDMMANILGEEYQKIEMNKHHELKLPCSYLQSVINYFSAFLLW